MPLLKFAKAPILLHPVSIVLLTWSSVALLYSLRLSRLLTYGNPDVMRVFLLIVLPAIVTSISYNILRTSVSRGNADFDVRLAPSVGLFHQRLSLCLKLWIVLAVFETIVSGGVPIVWLLTANGKVNFDYGIGSVHGLVDALLLALGVSYWTLFVYTGRRGFLRFAAFALVWALVLVSRGTLLVLVLEYSIIYLRLRPIKRSTFMRLTALGLSFVFLFGFVGDFRSGAGAFRNLAQPTEALPDWAPSGVLWAYIYITTPMNNLLYTMDHIKPEYNILLPSTAATLFPSVIRNVVYGAEGARKTQEGELQNSSLTVSTAYVGPFQDMGAYGIAGFSVVATLLCEIFWHKSGFWNVFVFSVFAQALFLSLFYNLLFSLPILGQLIWFRFFTNLPTRVTRQGSVPQASRALEMPA